MNLDPILQKYRFNHPDYPPSEGNNGWYRIPFIKSGKFLLVCSSDGAGWDHISVSLPNRCPSWDEMNYIKDLFFDPEEIVMQLHPPKSQYKNLHPFCLHLWRPQKENIPLPPSIMVAI